MLGKLKLGPDNNKANAGPLDIPFEIRACKIGISVKVEKYMKAPKIDAIKFPKILFLPTICSINCWGINGIINPATKTPMKRRGIKVFPKNQVSFSHDLEVSLDNLKSVINATTNASNTIIEYFKVVPIVNPFTTKIITKEKKKAMRTLEETETSELSSK